MDCPMETQHATPVFCPYCGKSQYVFHQAHEDVHDNEAIKCDFCKRTFNLKELVQNNQKRG